MVQVINIEDIIKDTLYHVLELAFDDPISFDVFNKRAIDYLQETYLLNQEDANWFYNPIYWKLFLNKNSIESPLYMAQAKKNGEEHRVGRRIDGFTNSFINKMTNSIFEEHSARFDSRDIFKNYSQAT